MVEIIEIPGSLTARLGCSESEQRPPHLKRCES